MSFPGLYSEGFSNPFGLILLIVVVVLILISERKENYNRVPYSIVQKLALLCILVAVECLIVFGLFPLFFSISPISMTVEIIATILFYTPVGVFTLIVLVGKKREGEIDTYQE